MTNNLSRYIFAACLPPVSIKNFSLISGYPVILTRESAGEKIYTCFLYTDIPIDSPIFNALIKSMTRIPAFQGQNRNILIDRYDFIWGSNVASKLRGYLIQHIHYDNLQFLE